MKHLVGVDTKLSIRSIVMLENLLCNDKTSNTTRLESSTNFQEL